MAWPEYDAAGNRLSMVDRRGIEITFRYDKENRLIETKRADVVIETTEYDPSGNPRFITDANGHTSTFTYDSVGNRRTEAIFPAAGDAFNKTYGYNTRDQLESIQHDLDPTENVAYTYDVNGNQLSKTKNGTITAFIVNSRNQITRIEENGLPIGAYGYDYQGLRVRKYTDHEVRYLYDDQSVLQREDANVGTIHYEYGPDRLLSVDHPSEGRSFYLHDALGSVVAMTGPGASLMGQYSYDAWGNYRHKIENDSNVFGFTGHEMDGESGLVYARARFYDPEVGRFLSHDPLEGDANNPPSLHRYLYAYQNPTVWVDPTGMSGEESNGRRPLDPSLAWMRELEEEEPVQPEQKPSAWDRVVSFAASLFGSDEKMEILDDSFEEARSKRRGIEEVMAAENLSDQAAATGQVLENSQEVGIAVLKDVDTASAVFGAAAVLKLLKDGLKKLAKRRAVTKAVETKGRTLDNAPRETLGRTEHFSAHLSGGVNGHGVSAELGEDGFLDLSIKRGPDTPRGGDMFNQALSAFRPSEVKGIRGHWIQGGDMSDNFDSYRAAISRGLTEQEAATQTFTGKMANRNGFSKVRVLVDESDEVIVEFLP